MADEPWTLARIYADLTCLRDVAKELDVDEYRVRRWVERRKNTGAPLPLRRLGNVTIYSMEEWKGWYARWARTRGWERYGKKLKTFSTPPAEKADGVEDEQGHAPENPGDFH